MSNPPGGRRRLAPIVVLVVGAVLAGLLWVLVGRGDTAAAVKSFPNKPAPSVRSVTLDGDAFELSRRKGSWVVVNFFDSTCVPCRAEHPQLLTFVQQQRSLGVAGAEFYTIVNRDSNQAVADFFATYGGDWPIIRDDDGSIGVGFGVFKVPETFIIDPNGVIVVRYAGQTTADELSLTLQQLRDGGG